MEYNHIKGKIYTKERTSPPVILGLSTTMIFRMPLSLVFLFSFLFKTIVVSI